MKTKECTTCKKRKPVSHFDPDERYISGYRSQCQQCRHERQARASLAARLRAYGTDLAWYDRTIEEQEGVCAICRKPETRGSRQIKKRAGVRSKKTTRLSVDHCHKTGKVRGLLCQRCNIAIGHLQDDIEFLKSAIAYLERHQ